MSEVQERQKLGLKRLKVLSLIRNGILNCSSSTIQCSYMNLFMQYIHQHHYSYKIEGGSVIVLQFIQSMHASIYKYILNNVTNNQINNTTQQQMYNHDYQLTSLSALAIRIEVLLFIIVSEPQNYAKVTHAVWYI